ncbi:MBL fold metallo-hydrolase [bacterium]|nr:MBL fold metallo-hydrolase [bacterium]
MIIKTYTAGFLENNMYLVLDEKSKKGILIDATECLSEIIEDAKGYDIEYILLTHGHFDHILGLNDFKKALNSKAVINQNDLVISDNVNEFTRLFNQPDTIPPVYEKFVKDGDELAVGNLKIKVLATPGHTEGGVCYIIDDKMFSGDTLFRESVGRTDLFGGDFAKLKDSIKNKVLKLNDNITVYPGHGPTTTIKHEKKYNELR